MPFFKTSILFFSKLTVDLDQPHGYKSLKRSSKVGWTNRIYRLHQLSLFTHLFHRFHVATDTSATVIVGILYQIINVAMIPRKVSPLERNYSTTKRNYLRWYILFSSSISGCILFLPHSILSIEA